VTWKARDMEGTFGRVFRLLSFVQVYQENHATGTYECSVYWVYYGWCCLLVLDSV